MYIGKDFKGADIYYSDIKNALVQILIFFGLLFFVLAYLSSYDKKAINALYELAKQLPSICLPHQDGGIPPSAFTNATTSKLAGLFSTLSI